MENKRLERLICDMFILFIITMIFYMFAIIFDVLYFTSIVILVGIICYFFAGYMVYWHKDERIGSIYFIATIIVIMGSLLNEYFIGIIVSVVIMMSFTFGFNKKRLYSKWMSIVILLCFTFGFMNIVIGCYAGIGYLIYCLYEKYYSRDTNE